MKIGFDLHGVIIHLHSAGRSLYEPGMAENMQKILKKVGRDNCHIVSFVSKDKEPYSSDLLKKCQFFETTGFAPENVHFIHKVNKADKVAELGLTHFVDDSPGTLDGLPPWIQKYLFCCPEWIDRGLSKLEKEEYRQSVTIVENWSTLRRMLVDD